MTIDTRVALLEQSHGNTGKILTEIKDLLEKQGEGHAEDRKEFREILRKQNEAIIILGVNQKEHEKKMGKMQSLIEKEKDNNAADHKKYDSAYNRAIGWSAGISVGGVGILGAAAKTFGWIH